MRLFFVSFIILQLLGLLIGLTYSIFYGLVVLLAVGVVWSLVLEELE